MLAGVIFIFKHLLTNSKIAFTIRKDNGYNATQKTAFDIICRNTNK